MHFVISKLELDQTTYWLSNFCVWTHRAPWGTSRSWLQLKLKAIVEWLAKNKWTVPLEFVDVAAFFQAQLMWWKALSIKIRSAQLSGCCFERLESPIRVIDLLPTEPSIVCWASLIYDCSRFWTCQICFILPTCETYRTILFICCLLFENWNGSR